MVPDKSGHATLSGMTGAAPGVTPDPVVRLLVTPQVFLAQDLLAQSCHTYQRN
jgi:hypothetical protein